MSTQEAIRTLENVQGTPQMFFSVGPGAPFSKRPVCGVPKEEELEEKQTSKKKNKKTKNNTNKKRNKNKNKKNS